MGTSTLNGNNLGNITSEDSSIRSELDAFNFPGSNTAEAEVFDYGDTKREIKISGTYSASDKPTLANWIAAIDALQTGDQDTIIFYSEFLDESTSGDYQDGNVLVKVRSFHWTYIEGKVLYVKFDISLLESI